MPDEYTSQFIHDLRREDVHTWHRDGIGHAISFNFVIERLRLLREWLASSAAISAAVNSSTIQDKPVAALEPFILARRDKHDACVAIICDSYRFTQRNILVIDEI